MPHLAARGVPTRPVRGQRRCPSAAASHQPPAPSKPPRTRKRGTTTPPHSAGAAAPMLARKRRTKKTATRLGVQRRRRNTMAKARSARAGRRTASNAPQLRGCTARRPEARSWSWERPHRCRTGPHRAPAAGCCPAQPPPRAAAWARPPSPWLLCRRSAAASPTARRAAYAKSRSRLRTEMRTRQPTMGAGARPMGAAGTRGR
mmetsp:Transcript_119472/g.372218  ORF Transcript_119472/g.372218 Transcript_119472/m.372218 type:complete len:203 (+) Transcript_119472:649-1257(+)